MGFGKFRSRKSKVVPQLSRLLSSAKRNMPHFKKSQNIGFFELRSEASGMVLVDRKVVCIGPD